MPKGPRGEKRPADAIGNAVHVMRIATGEIAETPESPQSAAAELGRKGGKARAAKLSKRRRDARKSRDEWLKTLEKQLDTKPPGICFT